MQNCCRTIDWVFKGFIWFRSSYFWNQYCSIYFHRLGQSLANSEALKHPRKSCLVITSGLFHTTLLSKTSYLSTRFPQTSGPIICFILGEPSDSGFCFGTWPVMFFVCRNQHQRYFNITAGSCCFSFSGAENVKRFRDFEQALNRDVNS